MGGLILQSVVNAQGFIFMAGYNAASRMQGLMEMAGTALQGLGDTVTPMFSGVLELFMRSGSALVLPLFMGEWGIYTAGIISWCGAAALLAFSCRKQLRRTWLAEVQ